MYQPVAYTFSADLYCPTCIIEELIARGEASPAARDMEVEDALRQIAESNAINVDDEYSFDSDDFPKVAFRSMLEDDDRCGRCFDLLLES